MSFNSNIAFFLTILLLTSCSEKVELDQSTFESKLDVKAEFTTDDVITVDLSTTAVIGMDIPIKQPNNATIEIINLTQDDPANVRFSGKDGIYQSGSLPGFFVEGQEYALEVELENMPVATSINRIPLHKDIISADIVNSYIETEAGFEGHMVFDLNVTIESPEVSNEFFHLTFERGIADNVEHFEFLNILEEDYAYSDIVHRHGILIDPSELNDFNLNFKIRSLSPLADGEIIETIDATLKTTTKDYYDYHKKLSAQVASDGSPINDRVTTSTNISNGFGLFAGFSSSELKIEVQ